MIPSGLLIINKPAGLTSHDVVNFVRKKFGVKRVGHAGTLDPAATGVLVVMVGKKATKLSKKLSGQDKEYIFEIEFGKKTDTGDTEGEVVEQIKLRNKKPANAEGAEARPPTASPSGEGGRECVETQRLEKLSASEVEKVVPKFLGEIEQTVPLFSAVKVKGKKLYEIARGSAIGRQQSAGSLKLPKREITIYKLELIDFTPGTKNSYPIAKFRVSCSKGTYTRALAEDIGKALGLPSYQKSLVRTRSGDFTLEQAVNLDALSENDIIPI